MRRIFNGMNQRKDNIYLFKPIFDIGRSTNEKYKEYNLVDIVLSVLLFTLDKMLAESGGVTMNQITLFLKRTMKEGYGFEMSQDEAEEFRRFIVTEKIRNKGNMFTYQSKDIITQEIKVYSYQLFVADERHKRLESGDQKFVLTEKGVELLFKTKEIFGEMQTTFTMLFFKQQLEKGAFTDALNTSRDLEFQIANQIDHLNEYKRRIQDNVINEYDQQDLQKRLQNLDSQRESEKRRLADIQSAVESVKQNYQAGILSNKQKKNYNTVLDIDQVLIRCSTKQEELFRTKQDLNIAIQDSLGSVIENAFSKRFHIEREILQQWISKKIDLEKANNFLKPLTSYRKPKLYNPLSIFEPQLTKRTIATDEEDIIPMDDEAKEEAIRKEQFLEEEIDRNHLEMMRFILIPLLENEIYTLSEVIGRLKEDGPKLYDKLEENLGDLFYASVLIHRSQYKEFEALAADDLTFASKEASLLARLTAENRRLLEIEGFEMSVVNNIVRFRNGEVMTDYEIKRKENV